MENIVDLEVFKGYEVKVFLEFKELMGKLLDNKEYLLEEFIMDNMEEEFLEVYGEFAAIADGGY